VCERCFDRFIVLAKPRKTFQLSRFTAASGIKPTINFFGLPPSNDLSQLLSYPSHLFAVGHKQRNCQTNASYPPARSSACFTNHQPTRLDEVTLKVVL
jgi:hypothetical protein